MTCALPEWPLAPSSLGQVDFTVPAARHAAFILIGGRPCRGQSTRSEYSPAGLVHCSGRLGAGGSRIKLDVDGPAGLPG